MQIVTDSGVDLRFPPEQMAEWNVHIVPLTVTLGGRSYREGVDIQPDEFYKLLAATDELPTTSQPSVGDFVQVYERLAATDPDILSIHMSSGLSGTLSSAQAAAQLVPEARVTHVDTKTLSAASGWQVAAAARALQASWPLERILALIARVGAAADSLYTLNDLTYLIHGGRISHLKGLIASVLRIKPVIGVEKEGGTYEQMGQARAFQGAVKKIADLIARQHAPDSALRMQVLHSHNPEGAQILRDLLDKRFDCHWLPMGTISLVLGAHTGPSMVGVAFAPAAAFEGIP
ncbi:MAG: DegV family protein [Chloroflexi bacterium]|nr:DegV family protein [Chloroflexota bacterium]